MRGRLASPSPSASLPPPFPEEISMRSLVLTIAALSLATGLSACGKSSTQQETQNAQATSSEQSSAATPPNAEQMKAIQATLPAPYNTADLTNGQSKFALC